MTDERDSGISDHDTPTQVFDAGGPAAEPLPDLGPKFEVLGRIGQGGMGAVYRVRHLELDHVRAVKVLHAAGGDELVHRLRREAAIATGLAHPNIVTVYDLELLPGGGLGIVMEYLTGQDLGSRVRQHGPLRVDELPDLFGGVVDALDRMHAEEVIHRDLKPDNLFLCEDGTLKILDFGISRHVTQEVGLTKTGHPLGTPAYMAPEQFEGREISPRTDVYALGGVLYFCLTGRMPASGTTYAEIMAAAMFQEPPRADAVCPDIPRNVADALVSALAKRPERRPASATELLAAVTGEASLPEPAEEGATRESEPAPPTPARDQRSRWLLPLLVALALMSILGIYGMIQRQDRTPSALPPPPDGVETPRSETEPPVRGGVLRAGASTALPTLDPLASDVSEGQMAICRLLFDTLVTLDWTGEVQPLLASSWTVEDGRRTFTFRLREDARFHDDPCFEDGRGRLLVAGDVKASLERILMHIATYEGHPLADMPPVIGSEAYFAGKAGHITGIETPDEHTVVVRFERPATEFLHVLSWLPWSITAREALEQYGGAGDLEHHVVGTGPYRVAIEETGTADLVLTPHEGAWQRDRQGRQLPFPDRIEVHAYQGPVPAATSLKEGRVDLLMGIGEDLREEAFEIARGKARPRPGWEGYQAGGFLDDGMREQRIMLLDRRSTSPVLADVRLRRAISLAIRREEILPEDSFPTDSPLVDGMLGHQPRTTADPGDAIARLQDAGYDGSMPPLTICGTASYQETMNAIHGHLAAVGLASTVVTAEPRGMHRYFTDGGCDALMLTMMGLVVDDDPLEYLISYASMIRLDQRAEALPEMIEAARNEGDRDRRTEYVLELARLLEEDAMLIVLAQRRAGIPDFAYIASPRVGGLTDPRTGLMNPLRERLHQLWVRPDEP